MSYVHKTTSAKTILAKVYQVLRPSNSSWKNEAIEDIGWAIQGIGYHAGFEKKSTEPPYLKVANNRVLIPCDVDRIIHIEELRKIGTEGAILNPDGTTDYDYDPGCNYRGLRMRLGTDTSGYSISDRTPRTTQVSPSEHYYNINGDYIVTSFTEGLIKIHYIGYIMDKHGIPKVIDDFNYKEAVAWYVIQNMMLKGYSNPSIDYKTAFQQWERYRDKAANAVKILSLDGAERFRASWMRAVNNIEQGSDFYMGLEHPEYISRD